MASFPGRSCLPVLAALLATACSPAGLQRQDQFAWAIDDGDSTSPRIVRVRLTGPTFGSGTVRCMFGRCMFGRTLVDAIMLEKRLPLTAAGDRQAVMFALSAHDHSYRFVRPASLKVINESQGMMDAGLLEGCALIEQGKSALWADMHAAVVEGPRFPLTRGPR